eukprot:58892_1
MADLAAQGQRSGRFRHAYGDAPKKAELQYTEIKNPFTQGAARYVSANDRFIAVSKSAGGGPVYILPIKQTGRVAMNQALLSVQKGKIWAHDFHPFVPNMIATASEDASVAVTSFPMDGLTETVSKADVLLAGHAKKVVFTTFNPSANAILASAAFDRTVRIWNIETSDNVFTDFESQDTIYSLEWNYDGSQIATTGKDKKLRLIDPRTPDESSVVDSFDGTKTSKVFWMHNLGWIGATGFSKTAQRQLKFWDLKNLSKPIFSTIIDQGSATLMPYYDTETGLIYMAGKGDGSISYAEVINDNKKWYPLGSYKSPDPQKGGGWLPKRACDVWKCEINRFFKLTKNSIIPIPFIVPRKTGADVFQEDIYPLTYAGKPALSSDEWLNKQNKDPVLKSMDPARQDASQDSQACTFKKKKTYQQLEEENEQLKLRVKELEAKLGINDADDGDLDEQKEQ